LKEQIANERSALTEELKLREDNSDPIKVHPELYSVSAPRPSVRDRNLPQNFGREHANASNNYTNACFKWPNLKVHLQPGVLNFKGGVSSRRSSRFDEAKEDPLHQPAGKDNSAQKAQIFL